MAAIDKIYGNKCMYDEFVAWLRTSKRGEVALRYIYEWKYADDDVVHHPISNFPQYIDVWLFKHCPIEFVKIRLREQYLNWS